MKPVFDVHMEAGIRRDMAALLGCLTLLLVLSLFLAFGHE